MEIRTVQVFTSKDEQLVSSLIATGIKGPAAKVLVFILNIPGSVSRDIERGTGLRQGEVSFAVESLAKRGWVTRGAVPPVHKGRPVFSYSLTVPFEDILVGIERDILAELEEVQGKIAVIRKGMEKGGPESDVQVGEHARI